MDAPPHLTLVLQFWRGDQAAACALARLLADIEPAPRNDVILVFARQSGTPVTCDLLRSMLHVGKKIPVAELVVEVAPDAVYPGAANQAWASAFSQLADSYYAGKWPHHSFLFMEHDHCPMSRDWIMKLQAAHLETLHAGKRVTGAFMRSSGAHIDGGLIAEASLWKDRPSLGVISKREAWDLFHAHVLVAEAGRSQIIRSEWGMTDISEGVWRTMARECAWLTGVKDATAHAWARRILAPNQSA